MHIRRIIPALALALACTAPALNVQREAEETRTAAASLRPNVAGIDALRLELCIATAHEAQKLAKASYPSLTADGKRALATMRKDCAQFRGFPLASSPAAPIVAPPEADPAAPAPVSPAAPLPPGPAAPPAAPTPPAPDIPRPAPGR